MIRSYRTATVFCTAVTLLAAAACGSNSSTKSTSSAKDHITYVTAFGAAGRDAFAWVAEQKGYFREAGIDVQIELGKATGENLKALASGKAQFTSLDLTGAMISAGAKNSTAYRDFRAVLAIHQRTLVSIMAMQGSGITTPKDLKGKRIAAAANSVNQLLFPGYAKLAGIDTAEIHWIAVQPVQLGPALASGKADALSTFLIGRSTIEKATVQARSKHVVVFPYSTYLPDLYGNATVTTASLAAKKPDLVKRFRTAMLKALKYTIQHPDEAGKLLHAKHPETDATAASAEIKLMTPSVTAEGESSIGLITEARMQRALTSLQNAGVVQPGMTPQDLVDFAAMKSS
ncbi:ABC transporter substrate-binding protein [Streptomyces sp. W16]|uniref:ABC transporter substrate-binding protein n=1 Tax=Streptomyces sp. W16 TaxID=3076631 RepID=UPI00295BF83F|nr:ABC transporter substrate-binding protein [Streptomyces sp. W16]MDV9173581.1 ABC transporter substrate-binding protein [Streptomyces sp. W16]